jgi:hypothetical protein
VKSRRCSSQVTLSVIRRSTLAACRDVLFALAKPNTEIRHAVEYGGLNYADEPPFLAE